MSDAVPPREAARPKRSGNKGLWWAIGAGVAALVLIAAGCVAIVVLFGRLGALVPDDPFADVRVTACDVNGANKYHAGIDVTNPTGERYDYIVGVLFVGTDGEKVGTGATVVATEPQRIAPGDVVSVNGPGAELEDCLVVAVDRI